MPDPKINVTPFDLFQAVERDHKRIIGQIATSFRDRLRIEPAHGGLTLEFFDGDSSVHINREEAEWLRDQLTRIFGPGAGYVAREPENFTL